MLPDLPPKRLLAPSPVPNPALYQAIRVATLGILKGAGRGFTGESESVKCRLSAELENWKND